jgi:hypothetical protein
MLLSVAKLLCRSRGIEYRGAVEHESWVIVLSTGGTPPDGAALAALADAAVAWVRVAREGAAACLTARVRHPDPPERFRERLRVWGAARGWAVAVAPGRRLG